MNERVEWPPIMVNGQPVMAGGPEPLRVPAALAPPLPEPEPGARWFTYGAPRPPMPRKRGTRPGVVPTSELPMIMLSWVKHGKGSDFGDHLAYAERPPNPGAVMRQQEALARWDAACDAPVPPRHKPHQLSGTRIEYRPRFDGIRDPDPLDVE